MRKYTKIGLIILSIVLFNTIFVYAESETQWPFRRSEKEINDLYEINKQEILEDSEFFKAHIEYPFLHIKNLNDREHEDSIKIIKDINDKIYKYVYKIDGHISILLVCYVAGASISIDAPDGFCTQKYIKKISKTS